MLENRNVNPAPRLPELSEKIYARDVNMIMHKLINFIKRKAIGECKNINFIVFDNTSRNDVILYDSSDPEYTSDFRKRIQNIEDVINVRMCRK